MTIDPKKIWCMCFSVSPEDMKKIIKKHDAQTVEDVSSICGAGSKCGLCKPYIQHWLDKAKK